MTEEILTEILDEFYKMAEIPRPSGHEAKISEYLADRLSKLGCNITRDNNNNIIADKTPQGNEMNGATPKIALQGHMDMVAVAAPHVKNFDPAADPITPVRDGEWLKADGTSLGADNGMGVATAICLIKHANVPLRLIVTTDEERGMSGARELSPEALKGVEYLINCDSENFDEIVVSSAGGADITIEGKAKTCAPAIDTAWRLKIEHLLGGHSGEMIHLGRANALREIALLLGQTAAEQRTELARLTGGNAKNVIAPAASAVFTAANAELLQKAVADFAADFAEKYPAEKPKITLEKAPLPQKVITNTNDIISAICLCPNGVMAINEDGSVLTSSNIGKAEIDAEAEKLFLDVFARSSNPAKIREFRQVGLMLAALCGGELKFAASPAWNGAADNVLIKLLQQEIEKAGGKPPVVRHIHAGLECGFFAAKNPALTIASIGITTQDIHSPKERVYLPSAVGAYKALYNVIDKLSKLS